MNRCKLCHINTDLVKAHVIPEAFFISLRQGQKAPLLVTDRPGEYPKRRPIGEYDSTILCTGCERRFGPWDQYAKEVFIDRSDAFSKYYDDQELIAYTVDRIDTTKLRTWFISVLWRASVSQQDYYRFVQLGPFEEKAKQVVLSGDPGSLDDFSVVLSKWDATWSKVIERPYHCRIDGLNYSIVPFLDYVAHIKIDKRQISDDLRPFVIGAHIQLRILADNFASSDARRRVVRAAANFWR
jgi:hypothetical protein